MSSFSTAAKVRKKEEGAGNGMKRDGSGDRMQGKIERKRMGDGGRGRPRGCCLI